LYKPYTYRALHGNKHSKAKFQSSRIRNFLSRFLPFLYSNAWSYNHVRELIAVQLLHTSLLNTTVVTFKVLPFGIYAPMPAPSPPFKTILELILWNVLQSCSCITPDVIIAIKIPFFQYFLHLREQKKFTGARSRE